MDCVREPDRVRGRPVRHEPGAGRHAGVDVRAGARPGRHLPGHGHLAGGRLGLGVFRQGADGRRPERQGELVDLLHAGGAEAAWRPGDEPRPGVQDASRRDGR